MESEMRCQQQPRHHQQQLRDRSMLYGTAVRISASSTLLASGWRGQYLVNPDGSYGSLNGDYVHRISASWTTASLQRSRTGNPGTDVSPAHAQSCSNAMASSSRRLSWFENGARERTRRDRTKASRQESPQRRPLVDEERGLEMTSLPAAIAATAAADNPSSNDASSTMQEIQPWGQETATCVVSSNPAFRGTSSSSSSSSQLSSSTSSSSPSSSSAESLPSYETALGMAVISDRERLLPSSSQRGCTSVSMTTAAVSSSSKKRLTSSSRDDSRDDTDSVETTSTYISDHTDTPRHQVTPGPHRATSCLASSSTHLQPALSPVITPSQRPPSKCRVIEDRETSL